MSPDAEKVNYKLPGFFGKFIELQKVMWTTNAGLTDRHVFDSRPDTWPRLRRGIVSWMTLLPLVYLYDDAFLELLGQRPSPNLSDRKSYGMVH